MSRAAVVQFHSCREGALVARGRETRLPRIPMHLHNCAYKFRTLPEGFGWLIVSCVYANVARCASSFADSEFYPNELFMRIRAILKRGCNFRLLGVSIVFAFRPGEVRKLALAQFYLNSYSWPMRYDDISENWVKKRKKYIV